MNLYLLTQNENNGYDTYDSMVISAENENDANFLSYKKAYMLDQTFDDNAIWRNYKLRNYNYGTWSKKPNIELISTTSLLEEGVVCSSFNAG